MVLLARQLLVVVDINYAPKFRNCAPDTATERRGPHFVLLAKNY